MERSRRQPLLATDDVGNLHQMVVDNVGQMIGGQLVGTLVEHLVVHDVGFHAHFATNHVVDQHFLAGLNLEAHHVLMTVGNQAVDLVLRQGERVAHHLARLGVVLEVLYLLALLVELLGGVEGNVGLVGIKQLLDILLVDVATLALAVGTLVATEGHALVELDAEPAERLDDVLLGAGHEAVAVGVFNTEDEVAAMLTGKEIVVQGRAHTANM